ncbi:MAG: radical SAM protein [Candidatus Peregrinibacteria bacterium]
MKVLLTVPPSYRFANVDFHTFHLGLGYLASFVEDVVDDIWIYDANIPRGPDHEYAMATHRHMATLSRRLRQALDDPRNPVWTEIESVFRQYGPDVLALTCKIFDYRSALMMARIAKKLNSKCVTVMGGPAATTCPEWLLRDPCVDFVVRGEGELAFRDLLFWLREGKGSREALKGACFRDGTRQHLTDPSCLIEDLDALPFPARDRILFLDDFSRATREAVLGAVITSRGCPYNCIYCANAAVWGSRRVRLRLPERVLDEVLHVKTRYGVNRFVFWDDHLTTKSGRIEAFCRMLIENNVGIQWLSFVRANTIDGQLLSLMRQAGCYELQMGVESGSDRILKLTKKGVTLDQIRRAAHLFRENGFRWHAFLMVGFPSETLDDMKATLELLYALQPTSVQLSVVTPYPGTELFEAHQGRVGWESIWPNADTWDPEFSVVDTMPADEFTRRTRRWMRECDAYNAGKRERGVRASAMDWLRGQGGPMRSLCSRLKAGMKRVTPPILWDAGKAAAHAGARRVRALRGERKRSVEWEYLPEGWAYAQGNPLVRGWNDGSIANVSAKKWPSFVAAVTGEKPLGIAHEDTVIRNDDLGGHNTIMSFAYVLGYVGHGASELSILDWGGGVGHYCVLAQALFPSMTIRYACKDVPALIEQGRKVLPGQTFYADDECLKKEYDLVMASASLHYHKDWQAVLAGLIGAAGKGLYIARLPTVSSAPSYVFVHRPYYYGYDTELVSWCLNRDSFVHEVLKSGLRLVREFLVYERPDIAGAPGPCEYRSFLFTR